MKPDTIIIQAPAGTKARWVRQSQREGLKLSEWVVKKVEQKMVYPVPEALEEKYHGAGAALAASVDGKLVDIVYLSDLMPEWEGEPTPAVLNDPRLAPAVRQLQALGAVHIGICSCWEFVEL